jgi:filamentous hemagglutinin family protein
MIRWRWTAVLVLLSAAMLGLVGLTLSQATAHVLSRLADILLDRWQSCADSPKAASDLPPYPNPFWNQAAWYIDPANSSGCASDTNNCSQSSCGGGGSKQGPCLTYNTGVVHNKWGTRSPVISANVTITWMSSQGLGVDGGATTTALQDPMIFDPILSSIAPDTNFNGPTVLITGTTSTTSTTITALTAKVIGGNGTRFQVTCVGCNTAAAQFSFFQNAARSNSIAWQLEAATTFFSQPLGAATVNSNGATPSTGAEVNNWTNGDTLAITSLPAVNIVEIKPTLNTNFGNGQIVLKDLYITEQAFQAHPDTGDDPLTISTGVNIVECAITRALYLELVTTNFIGNMQLSNDNFIGGVYGGPEVQQPSTGGVNSVPVTITGGVISNLNNAGVTGGDGASSLKNVLIERGTGFVNLTNAFFWMSGYNWWGEVLLDSGITVQLMSGGTLDLTGGNPSQNDVGQVWGPGRLDAYQGTVLVANSHMIFGDAGASSITMLAGHMQIQGQNLGCCIANDAGITNTYCTSINVNTFTLPCAAGPGIDAGLGGRVFLPGGGAFVGL